MTVAGEHETYLRGRRRGFLADLRRRRRRLAECGAVTFEACEGEPRSGPLLEELLVLEAAGWKAARGTAIAGRASTRVLRRGDGVGRARGTLRLLVLRLDGRPLAALLGVQEDGVHYLLKGGFDPAYARYSPGQLVLAQTIERGFADGLRRIELGGGADAYKLQWADTVRDLVAMSAFAPSAVGSLRWIAVARGRPLAQRAGVDRALRPRARPRARGVRDRAPLWATAGR